MFYETSLSVDPKINRHLTLYTSNATIKFLNIAATYDLVTAFESETTLSSKRQRDEIEGS